MQGTPAGLRRLAFLVMRGALAAIVAVVFLIYSLRWFLSRRSEDLANDLSRHLQFAIPAFQRLPRLQRIEAVVSSRKVREAAERHAAERNVPLEQALALARGYAREIVPAFNAYVYFGLGRWLARRIARSLYRVRILYADPQRLHRIPSSSTVVFVMNHRSNMDYILVSYLMSRRTALSYAVGEWARFWPLATVIRAMGAYFVRRNSSEELYRRVLERYITMATEAGVPQAVFPEGGLTRDGLMREFKVGVIDYMIRGFDLAGDRDLVFVPLGLNYDRVLEDRTQLRATDRELPRVPAPLAAWRSLRFVVHNLQLALRSRWQRFGNAVVQIGPPVSMREYCQTRQLDFAAATTEARRAHIAELGRTLREAVGRVVPAVPVAIVARVFVEQPQRVFTRNELAGAVDAVLQTLQQAGVQSTLAFLDLQEAIVGGLDALLLRHLVIEQNGGYIASGAERPLLQYYANSIDSVWHRPSHQ